MPEESISHWFGLLCAHQTNVLGHKPATKTNDRKVKTHSTTPGRQQPAELNPATYPKVSECIRAEIWSLLSYSMVQILKKIPPVQFNPFLKP